MSLPLYGHGLLQAKEGLQSGLSLLLLRDTSCNAEEAEQPM